MATVNHLCANVDPAGARHGSHLCANVDPAGARHGSHLCANVDPAGMAPLEENLGLLRWRRTPLPPDYQGGQDTALKVIFTKTIRLTGTVYDPYE